MDFSKQLASLQRSAQSAAASSSGRGNVSSSGNGGGRGDRNRKRGRDEHYEHRGGGGWRGNGSFSRREEELNKLVQSILTKPPHNETGATGVDTVDSDSANVRSKSETSETPSPSKPTAKATKHLALLFLTIDDLPFEHIWRAWLAGSGGRSDGMAVSILCHSKYPDRVKSDWLKQRLLIDKKRAGGSNKVHYLTRRPEWGSIEITRAMIDLVEEGLLIGGNDDRTTTSARRFVSTPAHVDSTDKPLPPVDKFVFVSETCLPVATLEEVETTLFGGASSANASSWLKARNSPNNGYSRQQQWDRMPRAIPSENIWKSDQWILLIREHAEAVARAGRDSASNNGSGNYGGAELWECFKRTRASDELYFPTTLSLLNIIGGDKKRDGGDGRKGSDLELGDKVSNRRITYCDWTLSARNPASFNVLLEGRKAEFLEVVRKAREEGCLFARKFIAGDVGGPGSRSSAAANAESFTPEKWIEALKKCG